MLTWVEFDAYRSLCTLGYEDLFLSYNAVDYMGSSPLSARENFASGAWPLPRRDYYSTGMNEQQIRDRKARRRAVGAVLSREYSLKLARGGTARTARVILRTCALCTPWSCSCHEAIPDSKATRELADRFVVIPSPSSLEENQG